MTISDLARRAVEARFPREEARQLVALLAASPLPLLEGPDGARERDRVHLGILKLADGDSGRFRAAVALALDDWRDLLVNAGLADEDWPEVLAAAGLPVP